MFRIGHHIALSTSSIAMDRGNGKNFVSGPTYYHVSHAQDFVTYYGLDEVGPLTSILDWVARWDGNEEDCLAARAFELIKARLKCDILSAYADFIKKLMITGCLESDVRCIKGAVEKCMDAGATPLACMQLILTTMTAQEASAIGW